jgi:hypothetical protein
MKSSQTKLKFVVDVQVISVNFRLWLVVVCKNLLELDLFEPFVILGIIGP